MTYYDWKKNIINNYQIQNQFEMKQFGIVPIDENAEYGKKLVCTNIFGTNDNALVNEIFTSDDEVSIIIGYGGNGNLHLGHLLLSNELLFYLKNLKKSKIYFVNFEVDDDKSFVEKINKLIDSNINSHDFTIIDYRNVEALKLKKMISKLLNIRTVNRIMGWKNADMYSYNKMLDMITTFAVGSILKEKNSIIITDINQKTYYALYKQIENKLHTQSSCFLYHMLMPSLKSPNERMSIKNIKSLVYLDDCPKEIYNKLLKSYSGMTHKESTCSILRVADLLASETDTAKLINDCISINNNCKQCKEKNIEKIIQKIIDRRG